MEKDPKRRRRDIGDVRSDLDETRASRETNVKRREGGRLAVLTGVAGIVVGIAAAVLTRPPSADRPVARFAISREAQAVTTPALAITRDGRTIVYSDDEQLVARELDSVEPRPIAGSQTSGNIALSPDEKWVGFSGLGGALMKVPLDGGAPVELCCRGRLAMGASWGHGYLYFGTTSEGILRVSENGGAPEVVVSPEGDEVSLPRLLPDGRTLLYTSTRGSESTRTVMAYSLETGERRIIVEGGSDARYIPTGQLVFRFGLNLQVVPFDLDSLEVRGGATTVVENVAPRRIVGGIDSGGAHFDVSESGNLVYFSITVEDSRLVWLSRNGASEPLPAPSAPYTGARISPDGARLAAELEGDIWLYEMARGAMSRLTFTGDNFRPVWTPDGAKVVFTSSRDGSADVYWKPADGSGDAEKLTTKGASHPDDVAPDGSIVYHEHSTESFTDLWILEGEAREPRPYLRTKFTEANADVSPDGRWIAYVSNESGGAEIYVRPFPEGGAKTLASTGGGGNPTWSRDGRELFYRNDRGMWAVSVDSGDELGLRTPTLLFERGLGARILSPIFDVSVSDERFLFVEQSGTSRVDMNVVLNWTEELEQRLAPAEN